MTVLRTFMFMLCLAAIQCGCQSQRTFTTPDQAVAALKQAVQDDDKKELKALFGPQLEDLKSGDPDADEADIVVFSRRLAEAGRVELDAPDHATLLIGHEQWPFAVPLVKEGDEWRFDTPAGIDELESRRIGRNERLTIAACRTLIDAQAEYFDRNPEGDGPKHYAQKLKSAEGRKDGLYWPVTGNEDPSPIGPVMAEAAARRDAGGDVVPYNGYSYRLLTSQGASASGGSMDYLADGRLTRGWAAIAWPAEYGETGIMSFLFGSTGAIYQQDFGDDTAKIAADLPSFDPGSGWTPVN